MEDLLGIIVSELYHHSRQMPPPETEKPNNCRALPYADEVSDSDYHLEDVPSYGEQNPVMGISAQFPLESGHQPRIQRISNQQQGRERAVLNHCNPAIFMIYLRKWWATPTGNMS